MIISQKKKKLSKDTNKIYPLKINKMTIKKSYNRKLATIFSQKRKKLNKNTNICMKKINN